MDNSIDNEVQSGRPSRTTETVPATHRTQPRGRLENKPHVAASREYLDENFYSNPKDMSMFDDVNNNRLNLPIINTDRFTVRQAPQMSEIVSTVNADESSVASAGELIENGGNSHGNETSPGGLNTMTTTVIAP